VCIENFIYLTIMAEHQKVHPFFTQRLEKAPAQGTFRWLQPLGPKHSCLHGVNLEPKASSKIAALDLDGTIIRSDIKGKSVDGKPGWEWWRSFVPETLRVLNKEGCEYYHCVLFRGMGPGLTIVLKVMPL